MSNGNEVSVRLKEVWEWRASINQEVSQLPADQALREILRLSQQVAQKYGFAQEVSPRSLRKWSK